MNTENKGYGIGTDVLTNAGWLPIENVFMDSSLEIAQFDVCTKEISFCKPIKRVHTYADSMKKIKSYNFGAFITNNQEVLINNERIVAQDIPSQTCETSICLQGVTSNNPVIIEDNWIRLLTWIVCDATIVADKHYERKKRIQFHLSKQRKIDALETLLKTMDIMYTKRMYAKKDNRLQDYFINIYGQTALHIYNALSGVKEFPKAWSAFDKSQLAICLDTIVQSDGYVKNKMSAFPRIQWLTTNKNDVDTIGAACIRNGYFYKYSIGDNRSGFTKNCKRQYVCLICSIRGERASFLKIDNIANYKGDVYNFKMPCGTIITRYEGKTAMSCSL